MTYITLRSAYGRTYKSAKAVKDDWNAEKDFVIDCIMHEYDGSYINKQQTKPNEVYNIRYDNDRKVCVIKGGA